MTTENLQKSYEEFISSHPEWHEYDNHCKECDCICCHHDLWGPPSHLYGDANCRCTECISEVKH